MKLFLGVYLCLYAASFNAFLISEFSNLLIYAKYIGSILLAMVSMFRFRVRGQASLNITLVAILGLCLLYVNLDFFWAMQFILVFLVVCAFFQKEYISTATYVIPVLVVLSIALDIFFNNSIFIFNDTNGRMRLLLGFSHPKEVAGLLFVFSISVHLILTHRWTKILLFIVSLAGLYFVGSRGTLVAYAVFHVVYGLSFISALSMIPLSIVLVGLFVDNLNLYSSGRLQIWSDAIEGKSFYKFKGATNSLASLDNYLVNVFVDLGLNGLLFLLLCLSFYLILNFNNFFRLKNERLAAFSALLSLSFFDSVMINITVPVSTFLLMLMVRNYVDQPTSR